MNQPAQPILHDHPACAGCPEQIDVASGCRVVESDGGAPLDAFLSRPRCFLKERMLAMARRLLAHRPASLLEPQDVVQDAVRRLLSNPERRAGGVARGLPAFLGYLRQVTLSSAVGAERRERGRMRCANCRHYAPYTGCCLAPAHHWTHRELAPGSDPRRLQPPCEQFAGLRVAVSLDPGVLDQSLAGDDPATHTAEQQAIHAALLALASSDPRAALVVRARLLEDKAYQQLVGPGLSLRTLKRLYARGLDFLRQRLDPGELPRSS